MLILLPFIIGPMFLGERGGSITYFFLKLWSGIFSLLTFIHYKIIGRENIQKGKAYIFVSNHTSYLDVPGVCLTIPGQFRPIAKKELLKLPVFGWIVKMVTVVVDRSSGESRRNSLEQVKRLIRTGISILIFAEGTQNRTDKLLQPFYDGAFRLAIDSQEPIIPMLIVGAGKLMYPGKINVKPGLIKIIVLPPVNVEGLSMKDMANLKQNVFDLMLNEMKQHTHQA